ncbi:hypothetical protein SMACR_02446 [Sordaria macrospora]|uniref:Small ribosomal subunit protein mS33 n=2 Tax=Sordaria macrospora TaxID=5147 RepID=F7VPL2_SORMK|nr:mitochondrial 37S ribosomal protein RSM27 [Sordaria macrospora k-hell]KAA8632322.1 hypothetical protein SMACR_02446 [Sordaria macrospora]KAH7627012.1 mitochondrial ribosomal subunit S27-domain-containing protein [Sordaria sp. MPI-SDFR-AT-0083]WPJ64834.1 hypothetical protein SMAC4_02446 [Sordaria macrospora]CCC07440.1 unnamed protein product [Sordaria macrospora k-hell]
MSVPQARLLQLVKARCELFSTTFNPERVRTGNKILRQRLKGPALVAYYPRKNVGIRDLQKEFGTLGLEVDDEVDEDRLEHLAALRARDKGAPKKKRTAPSAADSKGKKK